jgi:hypothetical protein
VKKLQVICVDKKSFVRVGYNGCGRDGLLQRCKRPFLSAPPPVRQERGDELAHLLLIGELCIDRLEGDSVIG